MLTYLLPVLPVSVFCLLLAAFDAKPPAERVIKAAVAWACILVMLAEGLSVFRGLTQASLALGWGVALAGLAGHRLRQGAGWRWPVSFRVPEPRWVSAALLLAIILPTGIVALLTLPNTWDALTYHVARVDHWIQNHSVELYQNYDYRQNESGPLAEYIILNFRLLSGTYALANLTQWFAMVGSLVAISEIAKTLGANRLGPTLAVVFAATIPMGVLQASSTQNDYGVGFWLLAYVAQFLRWLNSRSVSDLLFASAALGLAVLTKATALIFAPPFALWLLADFVMSFRAPLPRKFMVLVLCGFAFLLPNLPHATRNMLAYGGPLGTNSMVVAAKPVTIATTATNVIRNVAMNFGTPSATVNRALVAGLQTLAAAIGLDLNDRHTTLAGTEFMLRRNLLHEDLAGNPLHTAMILAVVIALAWRGRRLSRIDGAYGACAAMGFLIFSALVKWQPWGSRLMLPGFLLCAPLVGKIIAGRFSTRAAGVVLPVILLVAALPFVILNGSKPLIAFRGQVPVWPLPRSATMFVNRPELEMQYAEVASYLKQCGCNRLGLMASEDAWETPIFSAMAERGPADVRIEQLPQNQQRGNLTYPLGPFAPNAILWLGDNSPERLAFGGMVFLPSFSTERLHVFLPEARQRQEE